MRRAEIEAYIQKRINKPPVDYQYADDPFLSSLNEKEWDYLEMRLEEIEKTWEPPFEYTGA